MQTSRRLAVVTTEIGTRSEVWMMRQMESFTGFRSTLFGWSRADDGVLPPPGVETRLFEHGDPRTRSLIGRVRRRAGLPSAYLPDAAVRTHIRREVETIAPDAVLCHFGWNGLVVAPSLPPDLPLVLHVHGRDASLMLQEPGYRAALAAIMPRIQHLIAVGNFQLERLQQICPLPRSSVIPCGAPTGLFATRPLPKRAAGEPIRFVSVGRLSAEKGVLQSLAAFEQLHALHPLSHLAIVGEGPLAPELDTALARSPARAAVDRMGYRAPDALAEILAGAHVLLQHSREVAGWVEGFGVTLTEGGAAGLPLLASRSGGIPEQVFDGENGFLFAVDDIAAQAAAMYRLATDEALRRRMGSAARRVAQGFDTARQAGKLQDILLGLMADRR